MAKATADSWRGDPLPRGRHKLRPEQVRADQRDRLLRAMLELVAEHGYKDTSVPQVVTAARVSRSTFYAEFTDKLDCFLAVCDERGQGFVGAVLTAAGDWPQRPWREALADGMDAYLGQWTANPAFTRTYLLELPSAGPRAIAHRAELLRPWDELFRLLAEHMRTQDATLPPLPAYSARLVARGVTDIVTEEVRQGRLDGLPGLAPALCATVAVALGAPPSA
jgi:AcrR family transcriptional regulator